MPWSAWLFYEISHYAGYMSKNLLQIPTETIIYAIFSTAQGIGLKFFSIYPDEQFKPDKFQFFYLPETITVKTTGLAGGLL